MKIVGFNFIRLNVNRKETIDKTPKVTQNIDIKEVTKEKANFVENDVLKIRFIYNVVYSDDFANIEFEGNVYLLPEKQDQISSFLKDWKDKKIPDDSRVPLFNFIMGKCNVKALDLEDEFGLPLHLPMPRLTKNK